MAYRARALIDRQDRGFRQNVDPAFLVVHQLADIVRQAFGGGNKLILSLMGGTGLVQTRAAFRPRARTVGGSSAKALAEWVISFCRNAQ